MYNVKVYCQAEEVVQTNKRRALFDQDKDICIKVIIGIIIEWNVKLIITNCPNNRGAPLFSLLLNFIYPI